jgi:hypothetical protein
MDGQRNHYVGLTLDYPADRGTDAFEVAAPALSAVRCHKEQSATVEVRFLEATAI